MLIRSIRSLSLAFWVQKLYSLTQTYFGDTVEKFQMRLSTRERSMSIFVEKRPERLIHRTQTFIKIPQHYVYIYIVNLSGLSSCVSVGVTMTWQS
jgi:hypothetical protein